MSAGVSVRSVQRAVPLATQQPVLAALQATNTTGERLVWSAEFLPVKTARPSWTSATPARMAITSKVILPASPVLTTVSPAPPLPPARAANLVFTSQSISAYRAIHSASSAKAAPITVHNVPQDTTFMATYRPPFLAHLRLVSHALP